ncbi:dentin sialophosphoprotein-like [Colletes gigas]|uniref:dentin sialophosphoprotein-like n=1 Tax=Colletes gigas TaxID=935657 RepID=UPI001C9AA043|nr:dentin sialophosphoprotein-like [Colletes gigas]
MSCRKAPAKKSTRKPTSCRKGGCYQSESSDSSSSCTSDSFSDSDSTDCSDSDYWDCGNASRRRKANPKKKGRCSRPLKSKTTKTSKPSCGPKTAKKKTSRRIKEYSSSCDCSTCDCDSSDSYSSDDDRCGGCKPLRRKTKS